MIRVIVGRSFHLIRRLRVPMRFSLSGKRKVTQALTCRFAQNRGAPATDRGSNAFRRTYRIPGYSQQDHTRAFAFP
jgi:hypothetical protein